MTDYTVLAKFRNKDQVDFLVSALRSKGKSCYNFCDLPADKDNPDAHPEDQMKVFESVDNFFEDEYFRSIFERDLKGLQEAKTVIVLLSAGNSVHIESGIAYGLGKNLILIGEPKKPETLYLIFEKRYKTIEEFLQTI